MGNDPPALSSEGNGPLAITSANSQILRMAAAGFFGANG